MTSSPGQGRQAGVAVEPDTTDPARTVPRDQDGSLPPDARDQHPVPPNTLLWKYLGDRRLSLTLGRAGTTENMHPQLGQAVSDHSEIFTNLLARVQRSLPPIYSSVYGPTPEKTAVQIRNFHKPLKGTVRADSSPFHGTAYHGLDPQTFYWAHATFVDMVYSGVERFIKPLSLAEKEQIFQESRLWWSLYAVAAPAQPETYLEFQEYWDRVVDDELIGDTKVAQYTVGYISKGLTRAFPRPSGIPAPIWNRVLAPTINAFASFLGAGGLDPALRRKLGIDWSSAQDRRYRAFCATIRRIGPLWERFAPLDRRYVREAIAGFQREGVDPRRISVRSSYARDPHTR